MILPEQLQAGNLAYRDPALYDDMLRDDTTADTIATLANSIAGPTHKRSVLDLGCGTGRVATTLHHWYGWDAAGVDVQPDLTAYARNRAPAVAWTTADIRTVRLPQRFDVIISVGNTLAYLHYGDQLDAFFRTVRFHSHSKSLVLIATLDRPPEPTDGPRQVEVMTRYGPARLETETTRNPQHAHIITTTRTWRFDNGPARARDSFTRRVWSPETLHAHAARAGFRPLDQRAEGITLIALGA